MMRRPPGVSAGRATSQSEIALYVSAQSNVHFFAKSTSTICPIAGTQRVLSQGADLEAAGRLRLHRGFFEQNGDGAGCVSWRMLSSESSSSLDESTPILNQHGTL
jgi:hypothetical protein